MPRYTIRRGLAMTPDMRDRLAQLVSKQPRNITEADLIRQAIRQYLDEQEDLIGSRKHFQKSLRERVEPMETIATFGHPKSMVYERIKGIQARQQAIAIMRSLGSRRADIFRIVIFETLIVSLIGAILGRIIGYSVATVLASVYTLQSAIPVPVRFIPELELVLWVVSVAVGILAGLIPAWMAYRVNVVERLFPS